MLDMEVEIVDFDTSLACWDVEVAVVALLHDDARENYSQSSSPDKPDETATYLQMSSLLRHRTRPRKRKDCTFFYFLCMKYGKIMLKRTDRTNVDRWADSESMAKSCQHPREARTSYCIEG